MPLRTPLNAWHVSAGAHMIEFGGWEMPLRFTGIVEEHLAVRRAAGLFDVSHMGKILVEGPSAHAFLDGLSANDIATTPGRALYTHLLREDGTIIDDVIVTTLSRARFFIVCNAGPRPSVLQWLQAHLPSDVRMHDVTPSYHCLALQGPRAPELLQRFTPLDLAGVKSFWGAIPPIQWPRGGPRLPDVPMETKGWGWPEADPLLAAAYDLAPAPASTGPRCLVTRTGYTGEPGFELFPPATPGLRLWEALLGIGEDLGIKPVGLGARDTLRLEKGYLLSGQDFTGAQTPLEVNSAWVVKWDHAFVGKEALERQRARDDYPRLVGLRMTDRGIPRHGCTVNAGSVQIGTVTSGTMSPSLRVGIALASVDKSHAAPGGVIEVGVRGTPHPAQVVRPPFL